MALETKLTLEEFLLAEETEPASEYACGEAIQKPMPDWNHSRLQAYLVVLLFRFLAEAPIGEVLTEFRCIFGPRGRARAFVPDLVYVAREHLPVDRFLRAAPDLAIEILSPDQDMTRFLGKIEFYLRYGVRMVWVLDPAKLTVGVYRPQDDELILSGRDLLEGGEVLPGFSVPVAEIFAQLQV